MTTNNTTNGKIELLKLQQRELQARLAKLQMGLARRKNKQDARLFALVGRALVQRAAHHPDVDVMVKETLQAADAGLTEAEKNFLRSCGWLLG